MDIVGKAKEDASLPKGMYSFFQISDFFNVKLKKNYLFFKIWGFLINVFFNL